MIFRELDLEELNWLHDQELREAFPPEELKPYAAMEKLYQTGMYHPLGAWEDGQLLGYALLWESPVGKYVLIDYLGVTASRRNGGLGGQILQMLKEQFQDWDGIIVESEAPDGGDHDALRKRRMDFYRRNGYTFLDYDCVLFGVHYAVCLCSPTEKAPGRGPWRRTKPCTAGSFPSGLTTGSFRSPEIPKSPSSRRSPGRNRRPFPVWKKERKHPYDHSCSGILLR